MNHCEITIIGAGIVGLAIASELSQEKEVVVLEKNSNYGQETSSRNSEIIHAGIYYNENSLKAKLCLEGNHLLYDLCNKNNIPHKKTGKLIVATEDSEISQLEELIKRGMNNGVNEIEIISQKEIKNLEPLISAKAALHSKSTGIINTHSLMDFFYAGAHSNNAVFAFNSPVMNIEKQKEIYEVTIKDGNDYFTFTTQIIINSTGLNSDKIAEMVGIDINKAKYKLHFCKGEYFTIKNNNIKLNHLIFPLPNKKLIGLGIHTTLDLGGSLRLGPNAFYVNEINYDVDESHKKEFFESARQYIPCLKEEDLQPGFSGIRPKLQGKNGDYRDFIISHETENGFPGLINLIGIESPGLTCAPSIAAYVKNIINDFF